MKVKLASILDVVVEGPSNDEISWIGCAALLTRKAMEGVYLLTGLSTPDGSAGRSQKTIKKKWRKLQR